MEPRAEEQGGSEVAGRIADPDRRRLPTRTALVGVGLLAGVLSWLAGEATLNLVRPVTRWVNSFGVMLPAADRWAETVAAMANAGVAFAELGGLLGAGMGLLGGLAAGSLRRATLAALVGLALGVVVEAALTAALLGPYGSWRFRHPDEASRDLLLPLLVFPGIWLGTGVAAGLAYAGGARQPVARAALHGATGAALAGAGFLLAEACLFASGDSFRFVGDSALVRLGARLAVGLGVGLALVAALQAPPRRDQAQGPGSTTV